MDKYLLTEKIKAEALSLGFFACGIARADPVGEDMEHFREWLSMGNNAGMKYMENYFDKRGDPRLLAEGTKSIVSVALNYYPKQILNNKQYQFAWYAYGKDYHEVMKKKLGILFARLNECVTVSGRVFCDTAPVLERYWAWRAGLGWIGKNTQLIIPHAGSCFFLGELFLDMELDYDVPQKSRCGTCTRCLEACPARALEAPYILNAGKCLSYLTIENKGDIPSEQAGSMGNRIYGCDECQKVCPWNRFTIPTGEPEFQPSDPFMRMTPSQWQELSVEEYRMLFKGSAVKRAGYDGLMRNISTVTKLKK